MDYSISSFYNVLPLHSAPHLSLVPLELFSKGGSSKLSKDLGTCDFSHCYISCLFFNTIKLQLYFRKKISFENLDLIIVVKVETQCLHLLLLIILNPYNMYTITFSKGFFELSLSFDNSP